ncbi:MAG: RIP metalloprotease RseP [Sandaracinaceae bacterium]
MEVLYFIVLVGVLIFVHELGHFVWAKFFGVRVLKFSLGFGPRLFGFSRGETEYVIAAFPLGGYVRMLGENPYDTIQEADEGRAFSQLPLLKRVVIVFAGPAMNLLLPLLLFFVVYMGDTTTRPAVIGTVFPDQPADGVLEPGDRVLSVDGDEITTFYELARIIEAHPEEELELVVERGEDERTVTLTPFRARRVRPLDLIDEIGRVGIKPHHPLAVIGVTSPSSPAAVAGLRTGDRVVAVGGHPARQRWLDLQRAFAGNRGSTVPLSYMRPTPVEGALGGLIELDVYEPRITQIAPEPGPGEALERAGLEPVDLYVSHVTAPATTRSAALLPGDRLVALDGRSLRMWATMLSDIEVEPERRHELTWRRGDQQVTREFQLRAAASVTSDDADQRILVLDPDTGRQIATLDHDYPWVLDEPIETPSPILYAIDQSFRITAELMEVTVYSVVRLVQGRLSVRSIGGPLQVLEATEAAAREGALNYLMLMAFISINLGLINLLPIPMLDGGHLMFFLVEALTRRPVSTRVREVASLIGLVLLISLMVLAFKNDIERRWPEIREAFASEEAE